MLLRLTRLFSTIIMLVLNTLATSLPLNGLSTGDLSDTLSTLITPAGFTFSIWGLIYTGIIWLTIAILLKKITLPDRVMVWYIVSSLANGLRIVVRHYQNLHLAMIFMLVLLVSLIVIDRLILRQSSSIAYFPRVRWVFLTYLGWVSIASLLMLTIYLQYQLNRINIYSAVWVGMITLIVAGSLNLLIICREKTIITSLVALRALWGIISGQTNPTIILTAQVMMGLLIAGIVWFGAKKLLKRS